MHLLREREVDLVLRASESSFARQRYVLYQLLIAEPLVRFLVQLVQHRKEPLQKCEQVERALHHLLYLVKV